ncbi:MAG: DNA polymerase III subunit beta [Eubacteriaceae bacterium]|nr:DNA polymerase III subunit beta [Eubacteriaceae bacterium]
MKFSAENRDLNKALSIAFRAMTQKVAIPVLECIHITASRDTLTFKASDTELSVITSIPAEVEREGCVIVPIRTIYDMTRTYPDEKVFFNVDENYQINIKCSKSDVTILGQDPEDYPLFEEPEDVKYLSIASETFKDLIRETVFACAAPQSLNPVLTGVLINLENDTISFAALDGFKLALRTETINLSEIYRSGGNSGNSSPSADNENTEGNDPADSGNNQNSADFGAGGLKAIVPGRAMNEILKIVSMFDEEVLFAVTGNKFAVKLKDTLVLCSLIEGTYINFKNLIPTQISTMVKADCNELLISIDRAGLLTDEVRNSLIRMNFTDENLVINSSSSRGQVTEVVPIDKTGDDLKIAFNSRYFIDILKNIKDERIIIEFKDPLNPCLIKPVDSDRFLYLIMPVRYVE